MLKSSIAVLSESLSCLFNLILQNETFPSHWRHGYITPIYKGGDANDFNNYRAISVTSCLSKLFTRVLNERLNQFLIENNLLCREQIGFSEGHNCSDHIFVLKCIIDIFKKNKKPLYTCFIDFSKAFDKVWRSGLFFKMHKIGLSSKFVNIIEDMYREVTSKVKLKTVLSHSIDILNGTRQGCNLSPNLFKKFINDLPKLFNQSECDPIQLYDTFINTLMYADDIVLMSTSKAGLQKCLNILNSYCSRWKLTVNLSKSMSMVFNKRKGDVFTLGKHEIMKANSYRYLGLEIDKSGSFKNTIKSLTRKARAAFYKWSDCFNFNNNTPINILTKLFESMVVPIVLYGSEIWGAFLIENIKGNLKELFLNNKYHFERLQNSFCKFALGVKKCTSNTACKAELGIFPMIVSILYRVIKFYVRVNIMDDETLVKKCLMFVRSKSKESSPKTKICTKENYIKSIDNICDFLGVNEFKLNLKTKKLTLACQRKLLLGLKNKYIELFNTHIVKPCVTENEVSNTQRKKMRTYFLVKKVYRSEPYLHAVKQNFLRQALCKLRLSDNKLPIEIGRLRNITLKDRICKYCDVNEIGDEYHFLINCKNVAIKALRQNLFDKIGFMTPQFFSLPKKSQFIYLLAGTDTTILNDTCKFIQKGLQVINCT